MLFLPGCSGAPSYGWAGTTVAGDVLYVATMDGELIAYDLINFPQKLWSRTLITGERLYGRPVVAGDRVYIGGYTGRIYSFNTIQIGDYEPGDIQEYWDLDNSIVGGIDVALDTVYVGTSEGVLYALSADLSEKRWQYPTAGNLEGKIWGTPTVEVTGVDEGTVYFGSFDHNLYALDAVTGETKWDEPFEAQGAIASKPLVGDDAVYFGAFDRKFYAVDKTTGELKWDEPFPAGNWFWTEAIVSNGTIYVGSLDGKVYALNAATGRKTSSFNAGAPINSPPLIVGDILIVGSSDGKINGLDVDDLEVEKWNTFSMKEPLQSPFSTYNDGDRDVIYIYGRNSTLFVIKANNGQELMDPINIT